MTQDSLHGLRFDLRLVHQPVAKRVTKVVKPEPLSIFDLHSSCFRSRSEIVRNKEIISKGSTADRIGAFHLQLAKKNGKWLISKADFAPR